MVKDFCPPNCGLIDTDNPVCKNNCWHRNDKRVNPYRAPVNGRTETIVGKNENERYLESGGSIDKSRLGS